MKTKTLLLTLTAGALLCFSNSSYAQYHGGSSSSSSSSSGSGDGAFGQGVNDINAGIGFASGFGNLYAGTSASVSPAYELSYERGLTSNIGLGISLSDQSATSTYSYTETTYNALYQPITTTYTDTYKSSLLVINVRGAYHFTVNSNLDPYLGVSLGYATVSSSYSSNDPSVTVTSSPSYGGVDYGAFGGARYFFSSHVGAWAELQFSNASFNLGTYNGVSTSVSINSSCIVNLGVCFKF